MRRAWSRCLLVILMSMARVSLRWFCGWGAVKYQFWLPLIGEVRFGAGYAFRIPRPLGVAQDPVGAPVHRGILLPGKGSPVFGSLMTTALPKKKFLGFNSSLKSPCRISAEGTVID